MSNIKILWTFKKNKIHIDFVFVDLFETILKNDTHCIILDKTKMCTYVALEICNQKFAIYDYEFHWFISKFKWYPMNGYATMKIKQEVLNEFPDLPFELNQNISMDNIIKTYLLKQPKIINNKHDEFRIVLHHCNNKLRDNRTKNIMWFGKYEQKSIQSIQKIYKPPIEVRHLSMFLPKYCKWINAKKCYRIDEHPSIFYMIKTGDSKHKYIESLKGKKHTPLQKYIDVMEKYEMLEHRPFYDCNSYIDFIQKMNRLNIECINITNYVKHIFY